MTDVADTDKVIKGIIARMSTEQQYSTDATIRDYADASSLITYYEDRCMWEVRVNTLGDVSLPSDFYLPDRDLTYQEAVQEAQSLLETDLRDLIYAQNYDTMQAVDILDGRYTVRLSPTYRDAIDIIQGAEVRI